MPYVEKTQHDWPVGRKGSAGQVFINGPHPAQEFPEGLGADGDHQCQPHGRGQREPAADPLGNGKDHLRVDAPLSGPVRSPGHRHQVATHSVGPHPVG